MALALKTAPIEEPVSLTELRTQVRIAAADFDGQLSSLQVAARRQAEAICRRAFCTQTWVLHLDRFPTYWQDWNSWTGRRTWARSSRRLSTDAYRDITIRLEQPPVQSVASIQYYDPETHLLTTLDPSVYLVDLTNEPARLAPVPGQYWPMADYRPDAIQIEFTCGYGHPADVPETFKAAIKMTVESWFFNPTGEGGELAIPAAARLLLESEGWGSYVSQ